METKKGKRTIRCEGRSKEANLDGASRARLAIRSDPKQLRRSEVRATLRPRDRSAGRLRTGQDPASPWNRLERSKDSQRVCDRIAPSCRPALERRHGMRP